MTSVQPAAGAQPANWTDEHWWRGEIDRATTAVTRSSATSDHARAPPALARAPRDHRSAERSELPHLGGLGFEEGRPDDPSRGCSRHCRDWCSPSGRHSARASAPACVVRACAAAPCPALAAGWLGRRTHALSRRASVRGRRDHRSSAATSPYSTTSGVRPRALSARSLTLRNGPTTARGVPRRAPTGPTDTAVRTSCDRLPPLPRGGAQPPGRRRDELMLYANLLAIVHEHHRLDPYIDASCPRRCGRWSRGICSASAVAPRRCGSAATSPRGAGGVPRDAAGRSRTAGARAAARRPGRPRPHPDSLARQRRRRLDRARPTG